MIHSTVQNKNLRAGVLKGLKRRRRTGGGLQMTAMIDVIFLLLTFFVVTARFRAPEAVLPVLLPDQSPIEAVSLSVIEPLRVKIEEGTDGSRVEVGDRMIAISPEQPAEGLAQLANRIEEVAAGQHRTADDPVELVCGEAVPWDTIVKVYDVLHTLGLSNITFVVAE